ncbi:hypothetical protein RA2_04149 [Roseovarius sp. A-2]|nr:hypothetical protein RA2_04149 [Roseovarius sp. A-2]
MVDTIGVAVKHNYMFYITFIAFILFVRRWRNLHEMLRVCRAADFAQDTRIVAWQK